MLLSNSQTSGADFLCKILMYLSADLPSVMVASWTGMSFSLTVSVNCISTKSTKLPSAQEFTMPMPPDNSKRSYSQGGEKYKMKHNK